MAAMVRAVLFAAFAAGALAGLAITAIEQFTTAPLIQQAETFEADDGVVTHDHEGTQPGSGGNVEESHEHGATPAFAERMAYSVVTNVLLGIGFCLLLVAGFAFHGKPESGASGAIWGMAGFAVFTLAPALGLPPELPGTAAAELVARQEWWVMAAACTAAGLWLLAFRAHPLARLAGLALLFVPHIVGAPQPQRFSDAVPPELAARFAATSIAVSAIFWLMAGWLVGALYARFTAPKAQNSGPDQAG